MPYLDARPLLLVISGPSGAGKGLALETIAASGLATRIPTYTTRSRRANETDGVDYNFVSVDDFRKLLKAGTIFEYTRTYLDSYYGSPSDLLNSADPTPMAVELDPMGFVRVRATSNRRVVGIFVTTKTEAELKERLSGRGQLNDADQRLRIRITQQAWAWAYDYVLVNSLRGNFIREVETVVQSEIIRTTGAQYMVHVRQHLDPTLHGAGEL
jgi:guanylate kinase